ncbi:PD40 domain-containing protein [Vitiosangium sp. GDMCC 1.1324]|uniref:PD40 domain-containing protein n=1 Tax=Vitiosangium sp. (strain GDMCC 1.1324) TaxID=2138576 RepID=UPI000D3C4B3D|nr:PD40 domain-containing protein [Vitiosangium sp. GDMCC 1.1324]PTL80534.1 tolB protein precursor protein [Vitiosangium sp. GDMCC 1.1324]
MKQRLFIATLLALILPEAALAQVYVIPRRAYRSPVHTYDFEWRHLDILVGPEAEGVAAPPAHRAHQQPPGAPGGPNPTALTSPQMRSPGASSSDATKGPPPGQETPGKPGEQQGIGGSPLDSIEPGSPTPVVRNQPDGGTPDAAVASGDSLYVPIALPTDGGTPDGGPAYATSLGVKSGGVRFYFYESERNVAQYAAPQLEDTYRYLVDRFKFVPTQTFPYILYSSYQEFLQTNVTSVSEGTLGVTSTQGHLELTLPYLGDHRLFGEISSHEMTHQFTIQKVRYLAEQAKVAGDPLNGIPLWFIEGLAEFYAKGGLDPEGEMMVRDLLINPDLMRGYAFLDFWSPGPYGFLWIYKVGQARCQFLEETYGTGFIQKVLENSPKLVSGTGMTPNLQFEGLIEMLTGDDPQKVAAKFEEWLKQRAYRTYLKAEQSTPNMELLRERKGIVTALNSSQDGRVLMYRSIIPETGQSQLIMVDPRAPNDSVRVQGDGVPGYESLHPIFGRNFALTDDRFVFIAESLARDILYVQSYKHTAQPYTLGGTLPAMGRSPYVTNPSGLRKEPPYKVSFELGERVAYRLADHGLIAAYSPAFSPDGKQVAFIGLSEVGTRDIYVLRLDQGLNAEPQQITHDVYAERSLAWGPAGIVYTSDATSHGYYNLFRVKPEDPSKVERLTTEARDHADPTVLPDGRLFFVAYEKSRSDLHEYTGGGSIVRRTDVATGLFEPCPAPDGNVWLLYHLSGERKPALLRSQQLMTFQVPQVSSAEVAPPSPLPQRSLEGAQTYKPFARENIDLGPILGFAGAGGGGFYGQVFASATDRLRNHAMLLQVAVYGSFALTDGYLLYLDQSRRMTWGGGLFQSLRFRVDETLRKATKGTNLPYYTLISGERFFGATGLARYPLSTFTFLEANLSIGGSSYFLDPATSFYLNLPELNGVGDLYNLWRQTQPGLRFQTEGSLAFGYNTLRYHYTGVAISGSSFMAEVTTGVQPFQGELYGNVRLDAERYFPIPLGSTHVMLRGGAGTSYGGRFARSFYLSSFDTLRGVPFGDERWLLGPHYLYSTLELRVPLDALIRIAFLNTLMGVAGFDAGGVGSSARDVWDHRVLDAAVGVNVGLGPILLRLHFAYPFDINAAAGRPATKWVTQFSIGLAGLEGYLFKQHRAPAGRKEAPRPPVTLGGMQIGAN